MYTSAALRDIHERTHRSLAGLLAHCRGFSAEEFERECADFGHPSLREQFRHQIGAEAYWMGVLAGRSSYDDDDSRSESIAALEVYRAEVFAATDAILAAASDDELNRPRVCVTWGGKEAELVPAHVVLRTQTHIFQHNGQITALCRHLGRPVPPGLDFPLS